MVSSSAATAAFEFPEDGLPEGKGTNRGDGGSTGGRSAKGVSSSELRYTSETRKLRLQKEDEASSRFSSGDDLHELRQQILTLRQELYDARIAKKKKRVQRLERVVLRAQMKDPEFIYEVSVERMEEAQRAGRFSEAEGYRQEAKVARSALPQFNLNGLWVGKYADHFELVNVTYAGHTLIATKITGGKNVAKGQTSFEVDLSPSALSAIPLDPIELGSHAAGQWGAKYLSRFAGKGQVAAADGSNIQWMDGQLILVGEYFSFAWLPIGHQVFFGRPSPELTLKLLRQARTKSSHNMDHEARKHIERCWEETEHLEDELEVSSGLFTSHEQHHYFDQEGCFE
jgi:Cyclin D1 binding domain